MTTNFSVPFVPPNPDSWGPPMGEGSDANDRLSKFYKLPYAPFGRSDRIGRAADFTNSSWGGRNQYKDRRRFGEDQGRNEGFQYRVDAEEQKEFQLVDTTRAAPKKFVTPARRRQQQQRLRQLNSRRSEKPEMTGRHSQPQRSRRKNNSHHNNRHGGNRNWQARIDRQASVAVQSTWTKMEEFELSKLAKLQEKEPAVEDLLWCGFLDQYNEAYDKITSKSAVPLKRYETKEFYPVTTVDDPVIEKLAIEGAGNVFATDAILSHLMASPRSVYPWDVVVQKLPGGTLFLDKRDSTQFDFLTVNETSNNPPVKNEETDPEGINGPERLSLEATTINQNFSQQILKNPNAPQKASATSSSKKSSRPTSTRKQFELPNPFYDEEDEDGMEPASVAYRYRRFTFPASTTATSNSTTATSTTEGDDNEGASGPIRLVVRTELHGIVKKRGGTTVGGKSKKSGAAAAALAAARADTTGKDQYMTAFALNEFSNAFTVQSASNNASNNNNNSAAASVPSWRDKIDSQRGAVLATEIKNNSCKLAKWTAQSLLAGADQMKIGFVSRISRSNAYEHAILATQFSRPRDFAAQITLSLPNLWGIVKMWIDLFRNQPEGKYVLMRDPNRSVVRLYAVPPGTFEDEDDDNDDDDDDAADAK